MGVTIENLGLRERKKIQTRETIQRVAFNLFDEKGYANTTVEEIAEAAEVSVEALARQPGDLSTMQAFRRAFDITMATVSADEWELERTRQRLVFSLPELRLVQFDVYRRVVKELAEADSRRTGRDADDFELHIFFGALAGALMAIIDRAPGSVELMYLALDFIEAGMPLGPTGSDS